MTKRKPRIRKYPITAYQKKALESLLPPEDLTVSEWAEKYRMLDSKTSALPGPWRNAMTPYLIGVMDAMLDYETEEIVLQLGIEGERFAVRYGETKEALKELCVADGTRINPEKVGCMTGTMIGMFASGNGEDCENQAEFGWFEMK